jgi:hypothetical protein
LFWRFYYAFKKNNYLKVSTILICTCAVSSAILNIDENNCMNKLNYNDQKQQSQKLNKTNQHLQSLPQIKSDKANVESFKWMKHCFLITNLFIYCIYGIIIGGIIIIVWYIKYKGIWNKNLKK